MAAVTEHPVRIPSDVGKLGEETPMFTRAYSESFETGSCLPLLKQELRLKIQSKRMAAGQPELHVTFEDKEKHPLTPGELKRLESRKQHNRISAKKCRENKKCKERESVKELDSLRMKNKQLWSKFHKYTQLKEIIIKKLLTRGSTLSEAELVSLLPNLIEIKEKEQALFVVNNVVQPELQKTSFLERYSEESAGKSLNSNNVMLQHNHILDWLRQCEEVHGPETEIQQEVTLQPQIELQLEVGLQTDQHCDILVESRSESDILSHPQKNVEMRQNFALEQIAQFQTLQQVSQNSQDMVYFPEQHGQVTQRAGLQDISVENNDLLVAGEELPHKFVEYEVEIQNNDSVFEYQKTNAVLQGLDFLLSDTT